MNLGLYTPEMEHDSCGIGCIANINGSKSHKVLSDALEMLRRMEHRGGRGADPKSGDGAGVLIQIPHLFYKEETAKLGWELPEEGKYGVGMLFFPRNPVVREECRRVLNVHIRDLGFELLGYRFVPIDDKVPGSTASLVQPEIEQVFVKPIDENLSEQDMERKLFVLRNHATHFIGNNIQGNNGDFYVPSFSSKVVIYKGQLRTDQVLTFYKDLQNKKIETALALVHSRFSTNTFPNWKLAQPFRFLAHNGEINTIRGNLNKMKSKETVMSSDHFTDSEMKLLLPITDPTHSDSANLDALVELLYLSGRSLAHVMMMMIPEAWQDNKAMSKTRKSFYKYHSALMEPWDGPAALVFTNGTEIGATLDRNGLRPSRYCITKSGQLIIASEAGALKVDQSDILEKGRLQPGRLLIADLKKGVIRHDKEIKKEICNNKPYDAWINKHLEKLRLIPTLDEVDTIVDAESITQRQMTYGYTREDLKLILAPMVETAIEPVGSMGTDSPQSFLSNHSQHISSYFKQLFAQVSNPPIDPIRERLVMSLFTKMGHSPNILKEVPEHIRQIHLSQPVLKNSSLLKAKNLQQIGYNTQVIDCTFRADGDTSRLYRSILRICQQAENAVNNDVQILILSDRSISENRAPIPSLIATGAVHHHLINCRIRNKASIVVEGGDIWETHHFATLIGYGASAVNPYMAHETIIDMARNGKIKGKFTEEDLLDRYEKAIGYGLLKIMSKMGISTLQSYQSAQIFEAVGLHPDVIRVCFKGTISRLSGVNFEGIAKEVLLRHNKAFPKNTKIEKLLPQGGLYQWKPEGEEHLLNPGTIHLLQKSTSLGDYSLFKKYSERVNNQSNKLMNLRSMLEFKKSEPISIDEVEPAEEIMKRFATGAMSFGSISHEAHSTLAIAMNRIGAKSNSGEGGEDEIRFQKKENGDWERSAIKQVASGRFGVTSNYLANADELQIKMAQGAKPGEGGQLPGHKVDDWIGRVRHSTPGVGLISPPPHHDIYSIEDLAQLIYDLKNANPEARINVKLVSEVGVGTIAAGVSKAKADVILVSGADGGTGASPISSIRHAGLPWELGLSEAHQTLLLNNLRSRVTLQTDGKIMTGRDLAVATLLGAEEWGISTAALIVEGCVMMRKCHLNTCPVGIATQNKELRKLFTGNPDHVINFFKFLAQELREIMAELGFRTINDMIGQTNYLKVREGIEHWKFKEYDLGPIIHKPVVPPETGLFKQMEQNFRLEKTLDKELIQVAKPAIINLEKVKGNFEIENINRAVGATLSFEISKKFGSPGLPENTIEFDFRGSAGQSFAAFLTKGVTFKLEGEANDYIGKGLSGGNLIVYPDRDSTFIAEDNIIIGNVAFYGATSGSAYIRGLAGERFAVRNSGVNVVIEGVGDHACEYMTGGRVIILGETGRNFGAGMSGGIAYIYDPENKFSPKCNKAMVSLEKPADEDKQFLMEHLTSHSELTGSAIAERLLGNWQELVNHFVKVIPNDYKAVLEKQRKLKETAGI
ncbi:MAG: glutamate synthase large subunit [Cyclobacteriaceae bacterium]|nr:glutamate synthase large subunit [Cyclobacteriaceae bacterium]